MKSEKWIKDRNVTEDREQKETEKRIGKQEGNRTKTGKQEETE